MKTGLQNSIGWFIFTIATLCTISGSTFAQEVTAQLSSREAWVGSPVILQLQISNAQDYTLPEEFEIDGCDVQSAGTPSQSSQITIYNGRRSESRTVTQRYLITPKREGRFEIPALEVKINDRTKRISSGFFVATKSETGDLLFVEVEGKKESVFVGEPLDLKLKIWIKPFVNREQRIKLDESSMWQLLSQQTSWGAFSDRMQELAENRQRPGGETVLREDESGNEREYYLYEVNATVYPTKPGNIDASDLQVAIDYPTELGRRRDPFDDFFKGSALGRSSLIEEMMGSRSPPFGRRLTVSKSRPIAADAKVASTKVLPVPSENQPADYRGAVGRYQIVTDAEPKNVAEGDPITLRIGVIGDGPMELVQAPPLSELPSLTSDFQVVDQALAGFVQNDTKVFITTIRPTNSDVKQVPAIPFSFFDPEKNAYKTVYSDPIDIEVEKSETLGLDAIVSGSVNAANPNSDRGKDSSESQSSASREFDFANDYSTGVLSNESPSNNSWWWSFAIFPPIALLVTVSARILSAAWGGIFSLRPAHKLALSQIKRSNDGMQLKEALRKYVEGRSNVDCPTMAHAVGQVRELNAYDEASKLESFCDRLVGNDADVLNGSGNQSPEELSELKNETVAMVELLEQTFRKRNLRRHTSQPSRLSRKRSSKTAASIIFAVALLNLASTCVAASQPTDSPVELETIFNEANQAYQEGLETKKSAPRQAKDSFLLASQKYQTLVNAGVRNSNLFFNLANALNQCGDRNHAILNYHRALWLDPNHHKAQQNLTLLQNRLEETRSPNKDVEAKSLPASISNWRSVCSMLHRLVGNQNLQIVFAVSSVLFWLLIIAKVIRRPMPLLRWAVVPLALLLASGTILFQVETANANTAIIMTDAIEIKSGDGAEFPTRQKLESVSGQTVEILSRRDSWTKVRTIDGTEGWLPQQDMETVQLRDIGNDS